MHVTEFNPEVMRSVAKALRQIAGEDSDFTQLRSGDGFGGGVGTFDMGQQLLRIVNDRRIGMLVTKIDFGESIGELADGLEKLAEAMRTLDEDNAESVRALEGLLGELRKHVNDDDIESPEGSQTT
ncbi:hypothetical protein [Thermocrispum agreste]|jgi:hypothetical protein|uniref:Uncharacterized protein n=1 Tax=Thermocrispum agreste TaxID=37925 RepID=A0ABD6FHL0_9PSEU|nr:hypothetical protein [Thermocrispum agreste]